MSILSLHAFAQTKDEARIKTIVESVGLLADTHNFQSLEKLYAPEVKLDYTSLAGGEVQLLSNKAIMTQWAKVLPGFDLTRHEVSQIKVSVKGKKATATADVIAKHWVSDLFWQVNGNYVYQLEKDDDQWLIVAHQFNLKSEEGTREVFQPAIQNAKAHPTSYLQRQQTREVALQFLKSLEQKDMKAFAELWDENGVLDMPYAPKGFPKRVAGKANLTKHYADWPKISGKADFTSKLVFYPMQSPELIAVEFKGDVAITVTGKQYKQAYMGIFHVTEGKVKLFREYFNPTSFIDAFGLEKDD